MKKLLFLLLILTLYSFGFEKPSRPLPATPKKSIGELIKDDEARQKQVYYDANNLKSLDQKKIQKHAPMLIIIDQLQDETEKTNTIAMTGELAYGIKAKFYPILTTASVLSNLIGRMNKKSNLSDQDKAIQNFTPVITAKDWHIYDVPESQFVLLVPAYFKNLYGSNSGIKPLPDITKLLDGSSNLSLKTWLDTNKKIIPFSKADLGKIFITAKDTPSNLIWDFIVTGHGTDNPPIIANLAPTAINDMFRFFDTRIKTGMVLIISCLSGGSNRTLLETTQSGIQINHNFILILNSVANEVSTGEFPKDFSYATFFFNNAAQIQDKGSSFDIFWEDLAKSKISSGDTSVHGFQNIPQVWFPGGIGFQSADIPDLVFSLGNVALKAAKENNESIPIMGDALVLVHPTVIDVPLEVYPIMVSHDINKKKWEQIPHIFELTFSKNDKQIFSKIVTKLIVPGLENFTGSPDAGKVLLDSLYPQFISLNTSGSGHLFEEINVQNIYFGESGTILGVGLGVIHFIRDAFLDVNQDSQSRIYFIDKLTGFNDVSLLLEASRLARNDPNKHFLEDYLQNFVGQNITLENVMILTNNNNVRFSIYFAIADTYWQYTSTQAQEDAKKLNWWNFRMMGNVRSSYDNQYLGFKNKFVQKPDSINQKSISAVLEEKQRQILLKKAAELKQGKKPVQPRPLPAPPASTPKAVRPLPQPPKQARPLPPTPSKI
jgi:hypothetical protein